MVAGVAYSSFAFKPLWHPPLVRNASFAIQNTIPMEYLKTLKFVFFLFTRQKPWKTHCGTKGKTHARCLWNRWFYGTLFPGVWEVIFCDSGSTAEPEFADRLSGSFRIIRGLGIGVDPRRVQGEVPKRSGVQSHCRSLRCSVLQLSHNSFIAVLVCSCPLFQSCLEIALPL